MPIPEHERTVYEHNPLAEVGLRVSIPTVLAVEARKPADLQDEIFESFPHYSRRYARIEDEINSCTSRGSISSSIRA